MVYTKPDEYPIMRKGKTAKDRANGVLARHLHNRDLWREYNIELNKVFKAGNGGRIIVQPYRKPF